MSVQRITDRMERPGIELERLRSATEAICALIEKMSLDREDALASRAAYVAKFETVDSLLCDVVEKAARIAESQVFYPDTKIGDRQNWVRKEIARKIRALKVTD